MTPVKASSFGRGPASTGDPGPGGRAASRTVSRANQAARRRRTLNPLHGTSLRHTGIELHSIIPASCVQEHARNARWRSIAIG